MKCVKYFSLLVFVFITGCAGQMTKLDEGATAKPDDDTAVIVFMRSSFVGSALGVEVFEVNDGKLTFIGQLPDGSKIAHRTSPGRKVYMAYGDAADFMIANVIAGKTYYSIVRPNWGTGGFAPTPVRADGTTKFNMQDSAFKKWLDSDLLEKKPTADAWFEERQEKYDAIYEDYWQRFQRKSPEQQLERTLRPEDGV